MKSGRRLFCEVSTQRSQQFALSIVCLLEERQYHDSRRIGTSSLKVVSRSGSVRLGSGSGFVNYIYMELLGSSLLSQVISAEK